MAKRELQSGDIVRVGRDQYSGIRFGALCRVVCFDEDDEGPSVIVMPLNPNDELPILRPQEGWARRQHELPLAKVKYAKQANRFEQRRG